MNILLSIGKFIINAGSFSYNVFSLKNAFAAVCFNTVIGFILLLTFFYYPVGGWIGLLTHLFFLYMGATYVYFWNKCLCLDQNPTLKIATLDEDQEIIEEI